MTNKKNLGIIGLVVLALIAGVLIYRDTRGSKIEITENKASNTLKNSGTGIVGDAKVEVTPVAERKLPPMPSLVRSTESALTIDPAFKKIALERLESAITVLKKDPKSLDNWISLGIQRKSLGDYQGAREAWEYAKALEPGDVVAWHNLGDLYHFYLKDYPKSEENWKQTIVLIPAYMQGYRGLYELYMYSYKEKANQVPVILKQGLAASNNAPDLKALLADYEKSIAK